MRTTEARAASWRRELYGVTLQSNRRLEGWSVASSGSPTAGVDVDFAGTDDASTMPFPAERILAEVKCTIEGHGSFGSRVSTWDDRDGNHVRFHFFGSGNHVDFVVAPTRARVRVCWNEAALFQDVEALFRGPVLSALLRLRGETCLHASVVSCDGRAFAVLGRSGAGKSTTAAALTRDGFAVVADDIAVVRHEDGVFAVAPAEPSVRLWPCAATALDLAADDAPRVLAAMEKRCVSLQPPCATTAALCNPSSLPLAAMYFLDRMEPCEAEIRLAEIRGGAALVVLAAQIYGISLLDPRGRAAEFALLGRLAAAVPLRRVHRPQALARLGELATAIATDARGIDGAHQALAAPASDTSIGVDTSDR